MKKYDDQEMLFLHYGSMYLYLLAACPASCELVPYKTNNVTYLKRFRDRSRVTLVPLSNEGLRARR
jgi:hypothetical protein